ncbi:unnamed protein product [Timema podura]|uniref:Uncharacterized protein n=1 Tax=Timema podura TaxID=61482 RepID=A0ABN7P7R3_TIMPD|nr:unnamed protein product [Timema podura]
MYAYTQGRNEVLILQAEALKAELRTPVLVKRSEEEVRTLRYGLSEGLYQLLFNNTLSNCRAYVLHDFIDSISPNNSKVCDRLTDLEISEVPTFS